MDTQTREAFAQIEAIQTKLDRFWPPQMRAKLNTLYRPEVLATLSVVERINRILTGEVEASRAECSQTAVAKPKPWTPESDPTVPPEFLARHRSLQGKKSLPVIMARAYLKIRAQAGRGQVTTKRVMGEVS